jgi:glycosyltransferase involved in cell wall biosynthesis/SAM-dependent methyltransferase
LKTKKPVVVFWGTYDTGKARFKTLINGAYAAGMEVIECHTGLWEGIRDKSQVKGFFSRLKFILKAFLSYPALIFHYLRLPKHDMVFVLYPAVLDILIIRPFALIRGVPVIWDVFISFYDTVVYDRKLVSRYSPAAWFLYAVEWAASRIATKIFLDTRAQAEYFEKLYRLKPHSVGRVMVGAEEFFFRDVPEGPPVFEKDGAFTVFYYGQFIPLQGVDVIVEAVKILEERGIRDVLTILVGEGQDREKIAGMIERLKLNSIRCYPWKDHEELVHWIAAADLCLGIFGRSGKARRVIPTRVFQLMAMHKPLITIDTPAIRELFDLKGHIPFFHLVPPGDAEALADKILEIKSAKAGEMEVAKKPGNHIPVGVDYGDVGAQLTELMDSVGVKRKSPAKKDEWLPLPRYRLRKNIIKRILGKENPRGKKCLEIGYGSGDMLVLYAKLGMEVYGFDFSPLAYENASRRIDKHIELKDRITLYSDESLVESRQYDYIMAFEVLEHIEKDLEALEKWMALLKPGGTILLSVPAHKRKWGHSDVAAGHFRRYERDELTALSTEAGVKIIRLLNYGFPLTLLLDPVLHRSHRGEARNMKKEEFSKESGIRRKNNLLIRIFSSCFFLFPFCVAQRWFFGTELGSGYILEGRKE